MSANDPVTSVAEAITHRDPETRRRGKAVVRRRARERRQRDRLEAKCRQLEAQLEERTAALDALSEAAAALSATLDLDEVLAAILRQLERVVAFDSASVFTAEDSELRLRAARGLPSVPTDFHITIADNPLTQHALSSLAPVILDDVEGVAGFDNTAGAAIRSWIGVALRVGERTIGLLTIDHHAPRRYTPADGSLVAGFARQAALALHNAQLYAEAQHRAAETALLLDLTRAVSSTLYLPEVLLQAAGTIAEALDAADVVLMMLDENGRHLQAQAATTMLPHSFHGLWPSQVTGEAEPLLARVLHQRRPLILPARPDALPPHWYAHAAAHELHAVLVLPLLAKDQVLGLVVAGLELEPARELAGRLALAEGLATSAAMAIEHARLFDHARRAAILEERSRLARELHDSVTQALFSINLTAQAASTQINRNPERAHEQLQRLQTTAQQALGKMRDLLLQLRPTAVREGGLVHALREQIARLTCQDGPTITLEVEGDERLINGHERGLYQIAQEALLNVVRHAEASKASVYLQILPEQLRMEVHDNGRGFNPGQPGERSLGLRNMAEHAAEMDGFLSVESSPGAGTSVTVEIPRSAPQRGPEHQHQSTTSTAHDLSSSARSEHHGHYQHRDR